MQKIVDNTKLPVFVKGILHPDDAKQALDIGVKGIIVSNHGGRQCDGLVSSLEMLPQIAHVVDKKAYVLFDSGIRTGVDIVKALALGADAVCIGRPIAYGLTLAGEKGVQAVLENLISEFLITLALCGVTNINQIDSNILRNIGSKKYL